MKQKHSPTNRNKNIKTRNNDEQKKNKQQHIHTNFNYLLNITEQMFKQENNFVKNKRTYVHMTCSVLFHLITAKIPAKKKQSLSQKSCRVKR